MATMFNFKLPGSHGSGNNGASNSAGTGNSIFSSIGLALPSAASSASSSSSAAANSHSNGGGDAANGEDLPPGWRLVSSRQSGKEYYLHLATGATQWDRPTDGDVPKRSGDATTPQQKQNVGNVFSSGVSRMGFGLSSMLTQANSRLQTTLQQKVGMAAAGGVGGKHHGGRGHADVDRLGQVLVEVYENERLDGKLHGSSDPKKFSDRHAVGGSGFDEMPEGDLPEGHEWATDWEIDLSYTSVDRDGWTYATDFHEIVRLLQEELSHASRHPADSVRRRRWIRYSHDLSAERPMPSPTASVDSSSHAPSGSWGNDSVLDKVGSAPESNGALYDDYDDDPFHRTAQKEKKTFGVNMKFPHRGGKDNTKDYQSVNLSDVNWLLKDSDATAAPTDEMMREKTANLEERIKEATSKSVKVEKELRAEHEAKAKDIAAQQKKLDALIAQYRKVQRENATLQISVSSHRSTVEALRKEATEKDMLLNEEQRALNAEMLAANQTLEEKAKALATARMRYKRDNKALAASVEDAKKRLEQQKAKAASDSQDPLAQELKAEMDKVRQLHAKLEAVRQHRLGLEEESKTLFNLVVEKKADLKFKSKKKLETALKDVDEKLQKLKEEQIALTKQADSEELRKRRNTIRSELGALRERRAVLLAEKRKQEGTD